MADEKWEQVCWICSCWLQPNWPILPAKFRLSRQLSFCEFLCYILQLYKILISKSEFLPLTVSYICWKQDFIHAILLSLKATRFLSSMRHQHFFNALVQLNPSWFRNQHTVPSKKAHMSQFCIVHCKGQQSDKSQMLKWSTDLSLRWIKTKSSDLLDRKKFIFSFILYSWR